MKEDWQAEGTMLCGSLFQKGGSYVSTEQKEKKPDRVTG